MWILNFSTLAQLGFVLNLVAVRIETLMAGGWYRIFYAIFVLQIILIDRYSGASTRKYLWYSKVPHYYGILWS